CSMICWAPAGAETSRARRRVITAAQCFSMCNSLELNILTQCPQQVLEPREHAAFGPWILLRPPEHLLLGKAGCHFASCRPGGPPARALVSLSFSRRANGLGWPRWRL